MAQSKIYKHGIIVMIWWYIKILKGYIKVSKLTKEKKNICNVLELENNSTKSRLAWNINYKDKGVPRL